jgi:hypothetical protein
MRTPQAGPVRLITGISSMDWSIINSGRMDTTLPFAEVRRRSLINKAAEAADDSSDFSQRIRASLPTIRH